MMVSEPATSISLPMMIATTDRRANSAVTPNARAMATIAAPIMEPKAMPAIPS